MVISILLLLLVPSSAGTISFPVTLSYRNSALKFSPYFTLVEGRNPVKQLQYFCSGYTLQSESCRDIGAYLVGRMFEEGALSEGVPLPSYQDDTIIEFYDRTGEGYSKLSAGYDEIRVDLHPLSGGSVCDTLYIPIEEPEVDARVAAFAAKHALKGIKHEELLYDVWNYRTSLHSVPGGLTLLNLILGMHLPEDMNNLYFFVDVANKETGAVSSRAYFHSTPTYFASAVEKFCSTHALVRMECHRMYEYVHVRIGEYFIGRETELSNALYVSYVVEYLVQQRRQNGVTFDTVRAPAVLQGLDGPLVDVDFIEIGTSNFNTISQLLDAADPLVGLAVEPYATYLNQLPTRPGVTKVNAAIVSEADALQGTGTVDLYYIPEEVVDSNKLSPFIKGCNSIGHMHGMHTAVGYEAYVQITKVPGVSIRQLLTSHRVRRIRLLKIDAEGYDSTIMHELYLYLVASGDPVLYPERIMFESGEKSQQAFIMQTVQRFVELGYKLAFDTGDDIALEYVMST